MFSVTKTSTSLQVISSSTVTRATHRYCVDGFSNGFDEVLKQSLFYNNALKLRSVQ